MRGISLVVAGCALVAWGMPSAWSGGMGLVTAIAAGELVYPAGLWMLRVVEPDDVALMRRLADRLPKHFRSGYLLVLGWLEH